MTILFDYVEVVKAAFTTLKLITRLTLSSLKKNTNDILSLRTT